MIQEYLFVSEKYKRDVKALKIPEGASSKTKIFKNSECWIFSLELPGHNERIAKLLSVFHDDIMTKFSPIILTNDAAAYFNKRLFPLLNEFELKLRSFLYLARFCTKTPDDFKEYIHDFEGDTLGNIFYQLFIDQDFVNNVKQSVNKKSNFGKTKIENDINKIPESPLWDRSVPKNTVTTLRENYSEVLDIRNDVMHAHDINFDSYVKDKKLFKTINQELTSAIEDIVKAAEEDRPSNVVFENFNSELGKAMAMAKETLGKTISNDISRITNNMNSILNGQESSSIVELREAAARLTNMAFGQNEIGSGITEALKNLNNKVLDPSKAGLFIPLQDLGEQLLKGVEPLKDIKGKENQDKDVPDTNKTDEDESKTSGDKKDETDVDDSETD